MIGMFGMDEAGATPPAKPVIAARIDAMIA